MALCVPPVSAGVGSRCPSRPIRFARSGLARASFWAPEQVLPAPGAYGLQW